jgi:hypothetical protein
MSDMRPAPKLLIAAVCSLGLPALASAASVVKHLQLERGIEAVHFSADGDTFAMLSRDEASFWKIGTGQIAHEKLSPTYGRFGRSQTIADGRFMLVAVDGLRLYDLATGQFVAKLGTGLVKSFAYDPVSQRAAVLLQRQEVAERHEYYGGAQVIHTYPTTIAVFDLADELDRGWFDNAWYAVFGRSAPDPKFEFDLLVSKQELEEWRYRLVTFAAGGREVGVLGQPEGIFFSLDSEKETRRFKTDASNPPHVASPDGSRFVSCGGRVMHVTLWSIDEGKLMAELRQPGYLRDCEFSTDSRELTVESVYRDKRFAVVWNAGGGREIDSIEIDPEFARDATDWSGDGSTFVAVSSGGFLRRYGADDDDPSATGRLPTGLLDTEALKSDRHTDGTMDTALYLNGSGSYAVWVIGRQAVVWSLP